ncbi:MAG TPA: hypothetical protein VK196_04855, partial [Magnetospirillum sp.]|nr:hypothetical protein [Magnetospirillum sp.]
MTQKARLPVIVAGEVHDPLDWLEHDDASTLAWRQDQAEQAIGWLSSIPCDSAWLRDEIRSALAYPTRAVPVGKAGRYFFLCSPAGADRASLWQSCSPAEDGREIAHPAVFDRADGKAEFRAVWPSFDGGKVIVAVTFGGRQSTQLVVLGIDDGAGATVLECLDTPAFAWAVWHDDRSFFWSRRVDGRQLLSRRTLDGDDAPVALPCDTAQAGVVPFVSEDGAWLVVLTYAPGVAGSRLFAAVNRPDPVFAELDGFQRDGIAIGWWSGNGLVLVPKSHGGGREVVEVDFTPLLDGRSPTNRILYRDDAGKLTGACALPGGGILLVERAADGGNGFRLLSADGALADVEAPSGVALGEWTIDHRGSRLLANFRQWDSPARLMAFDADGRRFQVLRGGSSDLPLVSTRMEVEAADGVAIPVTMIGPAGAGEKRPAPCILWGYGAFGLSIAPDCMGAFLPWFQAGGIVAVA